MRDFPDAGLNAALTGLCGLIPLLIVGIVAFVGYAAVAYWRNGERGWAVFLVILAALGSITLGAVWWLGRAS